MNKIITLPASYFRGKARENLSGNWTMAAVTIFLYFLLYQIVVIIVDMVGNESLAIIPNIYIFLVSGPLLLGLAAFTLSCTRKESVSPMLLFSGFERFGSAFVLNFLINLFVLLWSLIAIIPLIIYFTLMSAQMIYGSMNTGSVDLMYSYIMSAFWIIPLTILLSVPAMIAYLRYSMAFYIMHDHPDYGAMDCIRASKEMMKGNKLKLFLLALSFIGWELLAIVVMMIVGTIIGLLMPGILLSALGSALILFIMLIPFYFVIAYLFMAMAAFYDELATSGPSFDPNNPYGSVPPYTPTSSSYVDHSDRQEEPIESEQNAEIQEQKRQVRMSFYPDQQQQVNKKDEIPDLSRLIKKQPVEDEEVMDHLADNPDEGLIENTLADEVSQDTILDSAFSFDIPDQKEKVNEPEQESFVQESNNQPTEEEVIRDIDNLMQKSQEQEMHTQESKNRTRMTFYPDEEQPVKKEEIPDLSRLIPKSQEPVIETPADISSVPEQIDLKKEEPAIDEEETPIIYWETEGIDQNEKGKNE